MIFGVGFYSFTIGNLLKQKLNTLADYSRKIAMPKELENRIRHFIENSNKDAHSIDD
jgi:5-methylthioribose kinase